MPAKAFKRYDPQTKAAIVAAALAARKDGKTWAEAFQAGKEAGYSGSLAGLEQMVRKASGKEPGRRGRPPAKARAPEAPGGISSVEALIEKIVKDRVRAALDRAIAGLKRARGLEWQAGPVRRLAMPDWLSPASALPRGGGDNVALPPIPPLPMAYRVPHPRRLQRNAFINLPGPIVRRRVLDQHPKLSAIGSLVLWLPFSALLSPFSRIRCISVNFKKNIPWKTEGAMERDGLLG